MYDEHGKEGAKGLTNRNKNLQFAYSLAIGVVLLLSPSRAVATDDENHIQEIMAGVNGNSRIQFIVIKQEGGGNLWGPQSGETQSRVMLVFFDAAGRETGKFKFPHNVPPDTNPQLLATQDFANLPGAPTPDFIMPPFLNPIGGMVCFTNNPLNPNAFPRTDCVAYGNFPAAQTRNDSGGCNGTVVAGPPTAALPIMNTVSLKRTSTSCGSVPNSDFAINTTPTPTNDAGQTLTIPVASQVAQGQNLFNNETFEGNGRSCGTCHVASLNLALPPSNIQSRFSTVSATFDPLFIGETKPSSFDTGFDFNLNTLVLTQTVPSGAPCIGTLQGIITSGSGATPASAKVLTQVSPTTYLVSGGMNPALSGTVSDSNSCTGTVVSITAGSLGAIAGSSVLGLEDPKRMRTSVDTVNFPQGRGLILENIDGFPPTPPVFRKSPHLLNLNQRSGPFGLSGSFPDLQSFATGAVTQHFPRTLARNSGGSDPDFRLPTSDELAALEAFMRAQEFPAGTDPNKFDLNRFVITAAQQRGSAAFFGAANCSVCHSGTVLTNSLLFNTGVVNQTINSAGRDNLPCEPSTACGTRTFSVRQLFNIANLGPFFHDASAATLPDVLAFYNSSFFNTSPGVAFSGPINTAAIGPTATDDIIAFLEGISFSPFAPTFGPVGTGVTITGTTFTGATAVSFNGVAATFTENPPGTITTTVPAGATTGPITVTTLGSEPLMTTTRFTVTPVITSFVPASSPVGTGVTITGTTFTGATAVSFNGVAATFTVSSSGTITTTVPTGATAGPITVTTLDGTATSATSFTVTPGGPLFSLTPTPSSQTVSAGGSASYAVNISRATGFADNLTFSVAGLPAATTATFTPNQTSGNSSTMTVTTTARAQLAPWPMLRLPPANFGVRAWPLWAICVLVMVLFVHRDRSRRHIPRLVFATCAFDVLLCIGCGGGSALPPPPPPPPPGTPAGTFTITVTATSSNPSVQPVSMPVTLMVN
jgi:cytochrome c peroxidase